jgi:uncharacterized damage-inducible protein DinB
MATSRDDLLDLSDYVFTRLRNRMEGITGPEYRWEPAKDFTLVWRLGHITDLLQEERIGTWLGQAPPPQADDKPETADEALAALDNAYQNWRSVLAATTEESLGQRMGPISRHYGDATRRAFVLHILDELIHHGAEAALLRDLYAARAGGALPN